MVMTNLNQIVTSDRNTSILNPNTLLEFVMQGVFSKYPEPG